MQRLCNVETADVMITTSQLEVAILCFTHLLTSVAALEHNTVGIC